MYKKNAIILLLITACLACCKSPAVVREDRLHAFLTDDSKYYLLPPGDIAKPIDMAQFVSASFSGHDYFMNTWVKADETGVEIILFNDFGAGMGELVFKKDELHFSSLVFPKSLKPEYIVADFQLCFYDPLLLKTALKKSGLVFETEGRKRRVLKGRNLIIEIEETDEEVKLVNHLRGYSYALEGDFKTS